MEVNKVREYEYKIDYEACLKNNFRCDVQSAVKFYLDLPIRYFSAGSEDNVSRADIKDGFVLYPQALNPFLKIMETLRESRHIVILPSFNNDSFEPSDVINAPAYLIIKVESGFPRKLINRDI
jgi:hypothetical protein